MKTTLESNTQDYDYDFCLCDELNEKLRKAVFLLDEVRFKLASEREEYLEDFVNELGRGTKVISDAIRRLDQDPIV